MRADAGFVNLVLAFGVRLNGELDFGVRGACLNAEPGFGIRLGVGFGVGIGVFLPLRGDFRAETCFGFFDSKAAVLSTSSTSSSPRTRLTLI